ncbi:MAG: sterol carrier family protein [Propionibacteriaceae bacterium]|jgi:hypothetical protein|nr:sterol carrier family protein [Propionibacteriaceae bacterium]
MDSSLAARVRTEAKRLALARPGRSVELRIPPYIAVQLGSEDSGPTHRRGTPPAVVEMGPETFLALVDGDLTWADAVATHRVSASGAHTDLTSLFSQGH